MPPSRRRGDRWVYPRRKRCFKCRSYFGFIVIAGLYCSKECAPPRPIPTGSYRQHVKADGQPKRGWLTEEEAATYPDRALDQDVYLCEFCEEWHLGTLRVRNGRPWVEAR